jgi:hypothetical protein
MSNPRFWSLCWRSSFIKSRFKFSLATCKLRPQMCLKTVFEGGIVRTKAGLIWWYTHKTIGDTREVTDCGLWIVKLVATYALEERAVSIFFCREDVSSRFLWPIDPLLGKEHIPAVAYGRNTMTYIARQRINKQAISTIKKLIFLRSPCRGVIKGQRSFEVVLENLVEFWRWNSKVIEKK